MARSSSAAVAKIAERVLTDGPLTADIHATIADAIQGSGLPLNDRAILSITNKIEAALEPFVEEMRSLATAYLNRGFSAPPTTE